MNRVDGLGVESGQVANQKHVYTTESAHAVNKDSWQQVGLLLVSSYNCAYILSFSNLMLVPLGWVWGAICMIIIGILSFYTSWLLAQFHVIDGQRFIRYRDIMGFVFGRRMYYITWILQFVTLILLNMGFILLGGRALKEMNSDFSNSPLRLQVFIIITGVIYFVFANFVPTMSAMKNWLAISTVLALTFIVALLVIVGRDGKSNKTKDYNIYGSQADKVFHAFGAIAATVVCNNGGLVPEIQSTLRDPAVKNMKRALSLQFSLGLLIYYGVTVAGYWAYGSSVSEYLPGDLTGPKWGKILINSTAFLQSIIAQHMFVAPVHEALDTKFLNLDESLSSKSNTIRRIILRAVVFGINVLVTAAFPFMGDFVNLFGSFALFQA